MPRQTKPKRPNLIKLADSAATLLKAPGGGWTWQTAVDDVAGNAGLTDAERAELYDLLAARGCPNPAPGEDVDPFEGGGPFDDPDDQVDDVGRPMDAPEDDGPFYDRAKALDDPGEEQDPEHDRISAAMEDEVQRAREAGEIEDDGTPSSDEVLEALDAVEARERAQADVTTTTERPEAKGGHLTISFPRGNDDAQATAEAIARSLQDEPIEGLTVETKAAGGPERRTTRELLAEAEDTARRLRVRLLNEGARERLDNGRPLPSEAMRSLEALHPLRKTLRPAVFDQVMTTIVAEIEREWGPIVT